MFIYLHRLIHIDLTRKELEGENLGTDGEDKEGERDAICFI